MLVAPTAEPLAAAPSKLPPFAEVYQRQLGFVWRTLRRLGVAQAELADASQQVFLVVYRRADSFDGSAKLETWLFGICLRVASDFRSRAHVRRETLTAEPLEQAGPPTQLEAVQARQSREVLDEALAALDDEKRAVFVLYELEEWTMPEVAQAVGCPLQTAYSRHRAARKRVEEHLRERKGERP